MLKLLEEACCTGWDMSLTTGMCHLSRDGQRGGRERTWSWAEVRFISLLFCKTMQPLRSTAAAWTKDHFFPSRMQLFHFNNLGTACVSPGPQLSPAWLLAKHFSALPPLPAAPCTQTSTFPRTAEWIGPFLTWASCYKHLQWDYQHLSCCWLKISRVAKSDGSASCCDSQV